MNAKTKLSAKGQIVIPKDVREKMGLAIGESFDVIARGDELVLRRKSSMKKMSVAEATAHFRKVIRYTGPTIPVEQLSWHIIDDGEDI